jgi:nucleotidyltransferase/DNA polymerase involved in DNA repair
MPSVVALRHCPDLIILPGRFSRYEEVSAHFLEILSDFTPVFEPLSLDEAFGDLSSLSRLGVDALEAATELRRRIANEIGVGSGIGLGRNKLFAKLGSKARVAVAARAAAAYAPPADRHGRAAMRVALRQLAATAPDLPGLAALRAVHDRVD